jgi:serine/threonine protein kinase
VIACVVDLPQVDIYSYGLMLFELMTNGHKPFEELSSGLEIDKFILEVRDCTDHTEQYCDTLTTLSTDQ